MVSVVIEATAKLDSLFTPNDEVQPMNFVKIPFPKSCAKQAKEISVPGSRQIFERFMNGDHFWIEVKEGEDETYPVSLAFQFGLLLEDEKIQPEGQDPMGAFSVLEIDGRTAFAPVFVEDSLSRVIPDYLLHHMCRRVTHWFARQHLSKILSDSNRSMLFDFLVLNNAQDQEWKDVYDATVLYAMWILLQTPNAAPSKHAVISKAGEALEAMKKWSDAALTYRDGSTIMDNNNDKAELLNNAAMAMRRNESYQEAEELYLQAIRLVVAGKNGQKFNPNDPTVAPKLQNIAVNYDEWARTIPIGGENRERDLSVTITPLLVTAGWRGGSNIMAAGQQLRQAGGLKPSYRSKKICLQIAV